jgi:DNA-binding MarR family transcriptional regulator
MALRIAYLSLHRQTDAGFADTGVTADQFVLLCALAEGGAMTQQDLADRITSDRNTLRAMLLLLEEKGLVQREAHPTDKRARLVRLTPEGERMQYHLWIRSDPYRNRLTERLGPKDTETLLTLLRRFARALTPEEETR